MNRIEAIGRTKAIVAETQACYEHTGAAEAINERMCDWVGSVILAELRQAMNGLVVFPKAGNGEPEKADENACKELAARLQRRAIELATKKLGPKSSDEAVCVLYFFPRVIGALERIARVFDPNLKTADIDEAAEDEGEETETDEETKQV